MMLESVSIDEFISSVRNTIPIAIIMSDHSDKLSLRIIPSPIDKAAAPRWILELCSFFKRDDIPFIANRKLFNRDFNENLSEFISLGRI